MLERDAQIGQSKRLKHPISMEMTLKCSLVLRTLELSFTSIDCFVLINFYTVVLGSLGLCINKHQILHLENGAKSSKIRTKM